MHYLKLDNTIIIGYLEGEKLDDSYIEVTQAEYQKAFKYIEYNPQTKEFSKLKEMFKDNLQIRKEEKIEESKQLLKKWLEDNPLESSVTGKKAFYTVTEEKQVLLTQNLMLAQLTQASTTTWNCQGNICEEWSVEDLSKLAAEIEAYVRPKIKKQQEYEVQINECTTVEEVEKIEIIYETTI